MKDAKGHGSNTRGSRSQKDPVGLAKYTMDFHARQMARARPGSDDYQTAKGAFDAAAALASGPKSAPAPVHDSMTNQNADVWHGGPYTTVLNRSCGRRCRAQERER